MGRISYVGSKTPHYKFNLMDINVPDVQDITKTLQQQRPYQP
jgi:hypothetical protein